MSHRILRRCQAPLVIKPTPLDWQSQASRNIAATANSLPPFEHRTEACAKILTVLIVADDNGNIIAAESHSLSQVAIGDRLVFISAVR